MKAYTQGITKEQFVAETKLHRTLDAFERGTYGTLESKTACAVGCALKSVAKLKKIDIRTSMHQSYETHLGVPEWLARLEDVIFEKMSEDKYKDWPVNFAEAINEGSDLNQIKIPFLVYLMECNLASVRSVQYDAVKYPSTKDAIEQTESALLQTIAALQSEDRDAAYAAAAAARSARSAAYEAAYAAAARSAAYEAANAAAYEAANAAAYEAANAAAYAARSAADAAAYAADAAAYAADAAANYDTKAFDSYANKLLELIKGCK